MVLPGWMKRRPPSGVTSPAAMRSSVDLPDPLRPTRHTRSPALTASPLPASSGAVPKVRVISWRSSKGGDGMAGTYRASARRLTAISEPVSF